MRHASCKLALLALCVGLATAETCALESTRVAPPAAGVTPNAAVSNATATTTLSVAPDAAPPSLEPSSAPPAEVTSDAALSSVDSGPAPLPFSAVAGIPLDDGGELVLGPEEKISSDDHKAAAERFQHMRRDGKLAATSDLDLEVPRILKREQAGDIRGALLAARNALARLPDHQNLRQITARLQITNGDYGSALLTLAPLLEIDRDNWLPFYWAGVAELMQLNLDNARAYLARACQLDADRPEPWIARAVVEQEAGNFAGSLQLFVVARQRSPARPEILSGIAYSQAMLQQSGGVMPQPSVSGDAEAIVSQPPPTSSLASPVAITQSPATSLSVGNAPTFASGTDAAHAGVSRAILP